MMQDLRFALRTLGKSPVFAMVAVATLLLGIGANVTMFAFVDAALLRPLPFPEPARLIQVFETRHTDIWAEIEASYPDYLDWRAQQSVFSELAGYSGAGRTALRGQGPPQRVTIAIVTDNFFRTLGVLPSLGRDFRPGEESASAPAVAML